MGMGSEHDNGWPYNNGARMTGMRASERKEGEYVMVKSRENGMLRWEWG